MTIRTRRPGSTTVEAAQVALRVTVDPEDVAYTTSSPFRSTDAGPWLAISTNSSEALAPPVCSSAITNVDVGHATEAATTEAGVNGRSDPGLAIESKANTKANAVVPARRTRCMRDLPAGTGGKTAHRD